MQVLNVFHVLIAIALVALVLVQRGQGATAGAAFGSGASGTVFGARGAGNFLSRSTWVLAALFCALSLTMAVMVSRMMEPAAPDLGVVAKTEPATPAEAEIAAPEQSLSSGEPAPADMPAFEQPAEDLPPVENSVDPTAGSGPAEGSPGPSGDEAGNGQDNGEGQEQPADSG